MKTWRDIEELRDHTSLSKLIEEHGTAPRIARHLGCSVNNVRGAMRFYGLKTKNWKAGEEIKKILELK